MTIKSCLNILFLICLANILLKAQNEQQYLVGYGKADITYIEDDLGLFGYGDYHHRIKENAAYTSNIYSRVVSIKDPLTDKQLIYLHADLGAIFHALRTGLIERIKANLYPDFDESSLMMSASHTHCAPAAMSHYALYMMPGPGFNPELLKFVCDQMYDSVVQSIENQTLSTIEMKEGSFFPEVPVAFNRAVKAHNKNKEIESPYKKEESHLAINREMPLMTFIDEEGNQRGLINWFGVHPIEMLPDHHYIDGASKGYAAIYAEEKMNPNDVAIFSQSGAGDVMTADYHNHEAFEEQIRSIIGQEEFEHDESSLQFSRWNGRVQASKALSIQKSETALKVKGDIDSELIYLDLSNIQVAEEFANGKKDARTSSPVLGAPFLSGKFYWNDYHGRRFLLNSLSNFSRFMFAIRSPFMNKEERKYRKQLYRSQSPKKLVTNGEEGSIFGVKLENYQRKGLAKFFFNSIGMVDPVIQEIMRELKLGALEEHTILPVILPIQIMRIGNVAIAGIPTEITTIAHNRLQATILEVLKDDGIEKVLITSYANEYAGYTTSYEEYLVQRYEGGHTLYGKHQLGAFQTEFSKLAQEMLKPKDNRTLNYKLKPPVFSQEELNKRSNLKPLE